MKKILAFLLAAGTFVSANAQFSNHVNYVRNGAYAAYPNNFDGSLRWKIEEVNREYDARIRSIYRDPYMRHYEKERAVHHLEEERQIRIQNLVARYRNR